MSLRVRWNTQPIVHEKTEDVISVQCVWKLDRKTVAYVVITLKLNSMRMNPQSRESNEGVKLAFVLRMPSCAGKWALRSGKSPG